MFSEQNEFVDVNGPVDFTEYQENGRTVESFVPQVEGVMNALIPEDFNLNI
jgi:hypothetical protein